MGFVHVSLEPHLRPLNLSPFEIGSMFVISGAAYVIAAPLYGRLCDKLPNIKVLIVFGALLEVVAFILLGPAAASSIDTT